MKTITTMAIEHGITPARIRANIAARKRVAFKADRNKRSVSCVGGPWDGQNLLVPTHEGHIAFRWSTLTFAIGDQTGRYVYKDHELHWVEESA